MVGAITGILFIGATFRLIMRTFSRATDNFYNLLRHTRPICLSLILDLCHTQIAKKSCGRLTWKIFLQIRSTYPACRGWSTRALIYTSLMRVNILPLLLLGVNTKRKTEKSSCPYQWTFITPSRTVGTCRVSVQTYRKSLTHWNNEQGGKLGETLHWIFCMLI